MKYSDNGCTSTSETEEYQHQRSESLYKKMNMYLGLVSRYRKRKRHTSEISLPNNDEQCRERSLNKQTNKCTWICETLFNIYISVLMSNKLPFWYLPPWWMLDRTERLGGLYSEWSFWMDICSSQSLLLSVFSFHHKLWKKWNVSQNSVQITFKPKSLTKIFF